MADFWRWYVGTLDQRAVRLVRRRSGRLGSTGILSNSGPGAREAERRWGFEAITDDIVYSHEVGLRKPDPAIYPLAAQRLGVEPQEVVFLDDVQANVDAALAVGMAAVLHPSADATPDTIAAVEAILSR